MFYYLSQFWYSLFPSTTTIENNNEEEELFIDSKINIVVASDISLPNMLCVTITDSDLLKSYLPNCIIHYNDKIEYEIYLNIVNRLKRYNSTFWYVNSLDDFELLYKRYKDSSNLLNDIDI